MIVCIAEKPSVAKSIAEVLGATNRKDGYMEGNGYCVTWTFGHLCRLKEPHEYKPEWKNWSLHSLPMIPARYGIGLIEDKGIEKQFGTIEKLIALADMVVNCGDAGQEGELIQRWVMQKAGCKCPVKRLWISSLTEEAIKEGFSALHDQAEFESLYAAGLARAIGDWTLGINATRLYTMKYRTGRNGNAGVLSIGRVQTPTLAMIVKRQEEIDHFVPKQYWELKTCYRDVVFSATTEKIEDKEKGQALMDKAAQAPFTVTDVQKKDGSEAPPRLFDLTSLQVECNKKFAYSADDTLRLIQSLYEKKYTTYPRVDTTFLSDDIYPKVPGILQGLKNYTRLTAPLLDGRKIPKSKKVFNNAKVTDHHAIIPTGVNPGGLTDMERNVYDLVTRRFIAAFYPDCTFMRTTVKGEAAGIAFKVSGKQIKNAGWRMVIGEPDKKEKEEENEDMTLPEFTVGESGPHTPQLNEKWTQPPKPYTEATLLRAMETAGKQVDDEELRDALKENGIGRPSTRAAIIETLLKRNYIKKVRKNLNPTPTGTELIAIIKEDLLKSVELTGQWEKKLRQIENKTYSAGDFITELKSMVCNIVTDVKNDNSNHRISAPEETSQEPPKEKKQRKKPSPLPSIREGQACPICGKGIIIKGKAAYGCSRWREGCRFRQPFEEKEKQ
ncbi:MAG TPA: DNA topoisomerase 3 [Candidatus Avibacteroides excrementipullorum]|nr:DNA topoisomerase 3 [Candidatus Avibacteroides excrementipullorum]